MTAPKRRWFRFSLRTLFVVVAVLAALAAWSGRTWNRVQERRMALVHYPIYSLAINGPSEPRPKPPLLWRLFGAKEVHVVYMRPTATDEEIEKVQVLFPEATIVRRQ